MWARVALAGSCHSGEEEEVACSGPCSCVTEHAGEAGEGGLSGRQTAGCARGDEDGSLALVAPRLPKPRSHRQWSSRHVPLTVRGSSVAVIRTESQ